MSDDSNKVSFTEGESKLMVAIMRHLTTDIQFDAAAIATELGYKDGSVVKARWRQIKNAKLGGATASPGGAGVKKPTSAKKATPKKKKGSEAVAGDSDEEGGTPSKATKKRVRRPKAEAAEEDAGGVKVKQEEMEDAVETTEEAD